MTADANRRPIDPADLRHASSRFIVARGANREHNHCIRSKGGREVYHCDLSEAVNVLGLYSRQAVQRPLPALLVNGMELQYLVWQVARLRLDALCGVIGTRGLSINLAAYRKESMERRSRPAIVSGALDPNVELGFDEDEAAEHNADGNGRLSSKLPLPEDMRYDNRIAVFPYARLLRDDGDAKDTITFSLDWCHDRMLLLFSEIADYERAEGWRVGQDAQDWLKASEPLIRLDETCRFLGAHGLAVNLPVVLALACPECPT